MKTDGRGRRWLPVATAVLAGLLVACGPATPSAAPTAVATPSATSGPTAAATDLASEPAMTVGPEPTPADTSAGTPPCAPADLKASHGLVEDAGGSRLTEVVLVSAATCSVDVFPAIGLRDASGTPLVDAPSLGSGAIDLVTGVAYTSQVRLANWCSPQPAFPLTLAFAVGDGEIEVTGSSFPDEGNLPPCTSAGNPILEASAWLPTP